MNIFCAVVGLGNPGSAYARNRHNIGFLVVDALAEKLSGTWQVQKSIATAEITINDKSILLIQPLSGMNNSGIIQPILKKHKIDVHHLIVVHDELEVAFGRVTVKKDGSARGHNGLRSIIASCGADFVRLRFGIGRPEHREDVPDYVLSNFNEPKAQLHELIEKSVVLLEQTIADLK